MRRSIPQEQSVVLRGTQPASMDDITNQVSAIATDVKAITASLRGVDGRSGRRAAAGRHRRKRPHDHGADARSHRRESRRTSTPRWPTRASSASRCAWRSRGWRHRSTAWPRRCRGTVGENREDVRQIVENLRTLSADLKTTSDNLNAVTGQIRSGEGTVGKLLYSNEAHDRLTAALGSVESGVNELRNTLGRVGKMQLDLGLNGDYYAGLPNAGRRRTRFGGNSRSAVLLRLTPNPERNRFYNVELADDPHGKRNDKTIEETVTESATGQSQTTITHQTKFDRIVPRLRAGRLEPEAVRRPPRHDRFNAAARRRLLLQRPHPRHRRGLRLRPPHRRQQPAPPRSTASTSSARRSRTRRRSSSAAASTMCLNHTAFTFGGGIRWRDDDLKYLLGSIPIPK